MGNVSNRRVSGHFGALWTILAGLESYYSNLHFMCLDRGLRRLIDKTSPVSGPPYFRQVHVARVESWDRVCVSIFLRFRFHVPSTYNRLNT